MKRFIRGMKKQWNLERLLFDDVQKAPVIRRVGSSQSQLRVIDGGGRDGQRQYPAS